MFDFNKYYSKFYNFYCNIVRRIIQDYPEDIVQIAFFRLSKCEYIKNDGIAKSFMDKTIKRLCIDELIKRKRAIANTKQLPIELDNSSELRQRESEQEWNEIKSEIINFIKEEIENLPPTTKIVFKMFYFELKNTHEIAQQLNTSRQTIMNQLADAREKLKIKILFQQKTAQSFTRLPLFKTGVKSKSGL